MKTEFLREWKSGPYRLKTWETNRADHRGQPYLAYELSYKGKPVFEGEDFACSPLDAIDSNKAMGALLSFLALRPGDTDAEYFEGHTKRQLEFADEHGEELSILAMELEETPDKDEDDELGQIRYPTREERLDIL